MSGYYDAVTKLRLDGAPTHVQHVLFAQLPPEYALGTWEVGGPTTHVRDVAGVEPEDFLTIARRSAVRAAIRDLAT